MTALLRPAPLLLLAIALVLTGCDFGQSSPTAPDQSNVPFSTTDLTVGTGTEAVGGSTVTVQYGAWLYSDTAADHKGAALGTGASTTTFTIGASPPQVIPGFEQGVTGMKVGGTRRVVIPPAAAFGSTGNPTAGIPPNAALVLDILLQNVQ